MSIGDNIRCKREAKMLTQEELANKIGVAQSMIAQLERGTRTLTVPLGKQLAEFFKCSLEELIN